ncbi:hypothetical protein EYF80_049937 [Liparis tanakae]|uniref:Uncharacterized protein n=1 Tax=Liparis tanakae TaxID=230148 RepID=A0A4Z2FFE6_9TELE|nr:hypothetical protein EYF80_049937 [Liparis tanakae]
MDAPFLPGEMSSLHVALGRESLRSAVITHARQKRCLMEPLAGALRNDGAEQCVNGAVGEQKRAAVRPFASF